MCSACFSSRFRWQDNGESGAPVAKTTVKTARARGWSIRVDVGQTPSEDGSEQSVIEHVVRSLHGEIEFTRVVEAKEYRESSALRKERKRREQP